MTAADTHAARFAAAAEELTRMAAAQFRHLGRDDRDEAVQNTLALAWKSFRSLARQGRADEPGILKSVLWYSIRQTKAGRTVCYSGKAKEGYAGEFLGRGRVRFVGDTLDQFVADGTPVPDRVAFRLDVPAFLATLTARQRGMAADLMGGMTTTECAARHGVTPGAVSQFRTRFRDLFEAYTAG